jgi:hypothetical protein
MYPPLVDSRKDVDWYFEAVNTETNVHPEILRARGLSTPALGNARFITRLENSSPSFARSGGKLATGALVLTCVAIQGI